MGDSTNPIPHHASEHHHHHHHNHHSLDPSLSLPSNHTRWEQSSKSKTQRKQQHLISLPLGANDQLAPVITNIFNTSLPQCKVPRCFKDSTIITIPKSSKISCLNDYRPIALTSVAMEAFERLVLGYFKSSTSHKFDPRQFSYRANRSVDDAVNLALHHTLQHLDSPNSYYASSLLILAWPLTP